MSDQRIGVAVRGNHVSEILDTIDRAEELGIHAAWMTTGGARLDSITVFAAAALRTQRILLGTSIVPTFPRHPLVMVQQTQVVAQLAPGRFRLGVGPSHRPLMVSMGMNFKSPVGHLREYVQILKAILQEGRDLRPTTDLRAVFKSVLGTHLHIDRGFIEDHVFPESRSIEPMEPLVVG